MADSFTVDGFLVSIIAVTGTLLGSIVTYTFQRLSAQRAESFARDERLRPAAGNGNSITIRQVTGFSRLPAEPPS